jgi:hypothetical protein
MTVGGHIQYCGLMTLCSPLWVGTAFKLAGRMLVKCATAAASCVPARVFISLCRNVAQLAGGALQFSHQPIVAFSRSLCRCHPLAALCAISRRWTAASRPFPTRSPT